MQIRNFKSPKHRFLKISDQNTQKLTTAVIVSLLRLNAQFIKVAREV